MSAKTTNPKLIDVVKLLKKKAGKADAAIWDALVKDLKKSKQNRTSVNVSRINKNSIDNEIVVVPGKVLGSGVLTHRVHVAAFDFSRQAREKIESTGGTCMNIQTLIQKYSRGSGIKIIG